MAKDSIMIISEYKNPKQVINNIFELEANTIEFGWIPLTIDQDHVETDLPHMVQTSEWLIANDNLIDYKTSAELEAEAFALAKTNKLSEIDSYADNLIKEAYANPTQSIIDTDPARYKKRADARRKNNADKVAGYGEITLTQEEKDQAKTDQKLSEYEAKILADADKAETNMLKLTTSTEVNNFDVQAENWTIWEPPL